MQTPCAPSALRTSAAVSPSRIPPSERPGKKTPGFGRAAAAEAARTSAAASTARLLIGSEYAVALALARRPDLADRRLLGRAPRARRLAPVHPSDDDGGPPWRRGNRGGRGR